MARKTAAQQKAEEAARKREEAIGADAAAAELARSKEIEARNNAAFANPGGVADAHGDFAKPSRAGAKVIVACKLDIAYIDLQLTRLEEKWENTQTGPRKVNEPVRYGGVVRIRGTAYPRGTPPIGFPEKPVIVDGAALNFDIDAEWWGKWVEVNKLNPLVMNKMIFAHQNVDVIKGQAQDLKDIKSGLQPVNPLGDIRAPRSTRGDLSNIETEDSKKANMLKLNQLQG